jgi:hypothetical protein
VGLVRIDRTGSDGRDETPLLHPAFERMHQLGSSEELRRAVAGHDRIDDAHRTPRASVGDLVDANIHR